MGSPSHRQPVACPIPPSDHKTAAPHGRPDFPHQFQCRLSQAAPCIGLEHRSETFSIAEHSRARTGGQTATVRQSVRARSHGR